MSDVSTRDLQRVAAVIDQIQARLDDASLHTQAAPRTARGGARQSARSLSQTGSPAADASLLHPATPAPDLKPTGSP